LGLPEGTVDNGDGTYTVDGTTFDMSTGMPLYRDNENGGIDNVIDNGDGTYTIGDTTYSMDNNAVLYTTDADGNITVAGGTDTDTETTGTGTTRSLTGGTGGTDSTDGDDTSGEPEYFTDEDGNVWSMDSGGAYTLFQYADGTSPDDAVTEEETTWTDPDTGAMWTLGEDGEWTTDYVEPETEEDNTWTDPDTGDVWMMDTDGNWNNTSSTDDYTTDDSEEITDEEYVEEEPEERKGGLITMMKKGGVPRFADGDLVDETGMISDLAYSDEGELYRPMGQNEYGDYYKPVLGNRGYARSSSPVALSNSQSMPSQTFFDNGGKIPAGYQMIDGELVPYMPEGAEDNGDGTYTIGNDVFDMATGNPLYSMNDEGDIIYVEPSTNTGYKDNGDGTYTLNGTTFDVETDMPLYRDNPKGGVDIAEDNGDGTYTVGGSTYSMDNNNRLYDTDKNGNIINVSPDARYTGGGNPLVNTSGGSNFVGQDLFNNITSALGTTAGAAGAGALLASLLGGDFGGGTGNQNQGIDMSKVGVVNPRTTDFGIGPTRYVGYEDYGVAPDQEYTPNEELLKNLNAPGYNPVNEGDYGYADDAMPPDEHMMGKTEETEEPPKMAAGGLSSMAPQPSQTHYTFGKPVDVYATLGLRDAPVASPVDAPQPIAPPQGQQPPQGQPPMGGLPKPPMGGMPQGMPPQMAQGAPQGMPPAMPPPMRRGGLPHASNVPMVEGRYDFRNGSAVHGAGDGQSDDIPAMLADGEYVIDAETVAQIGNGSTKAGAQALDKFRESIRAHKRSAPLNKIPPKTKALTSYLKGAK
jgi:hypothetical protein